MKGDALQLCELVTEDMGVRAYKTELIIEFVHYQSEEHPVDSDELEEVGWWNKLCDVKPELDWKGAHQLVMFRLYELVSPASPLFIKMSQQGEGECAGIYIDERTSRGFNALLSTAVSSCVILTFELGASVDNKGISTQPHSTCMHSHRRPSPIIAIITCHDGRWRPPPG